MHKLNKLLTGSNPVRHNNPRRPQKHMAEILKVIVPAMVGPTAHKRSAGVWTLVREASYTNTEPVLGNWSIRNVGK